MSIKILGTVDRLVSNDERVVQLSGDNDGVIASFYDKTNNPSLFLDGTSARLGNVGVKTAAPNEALTVNGNVSTNNVYYDKIGNSNLWNSTYTAVNSNSATWSDPNIDNIQGYPVSTQTPAIGQILQWSGTAWVAGAIPNGGSGGGGVVYYLNHGLSADNPIEGLSGSHYELGRFTTLSGVTATYTNISQSNWNTLETFVTDHLDPDITTVPAGIWDLNFWASATSSSQSQMTVRYLVYTYNESLSTTTLIGTSDIYNIYDPTVVAQYVLSMIIPQTTIDINSRIYLVLQAKATSPNKDITIYYNNNKPTHIHTSIPAVGGSGLVKVLNGVYQNPGSLLVDTDVAENAQIAQSKIYGLSSSLDSKFNKTDIIPLSSGGTGTTALSVAINYIIDGGGDVITAGSKGYVLIPSDMTIQQWSITSDRSTTSVLNVKRANYTNFPTTSSIVSNDPPSITSSTKNRNTSVTAWSTLSAGDYLEFYVTSNSASKLMTISLIGVKTN